MDKSQEFDSTEALEIIDSEVSGGAALGASSAEAALVTGLGLSVSVRMGEVETLEHHRDKHLAITLYNGTNKGSASSSDLRAPAIKDLLQAAWSIASHTSDDPYNGLVDADLLATNVPDLDLYHPWSLQAERAINLARQCEDAARDHDHLITNSEGATVSCHAGAYCYANTHGFRGAWQSTRHSVSCAVIAGASDKMQKGHWYTIARAHEDLDLPESVGMVAAQRAVHRVGARQLKTRSTPVVVEAPVAAGLLHHFVSAVSGPALYRKASFLLDKVGRPIFAPHVTLREQPHLARGLGSAPFDREGVTTSSRDLVSNGVLNGYVLDGYSARKLDLPPTGNAGGVHNLTADSSKADLSGLLAQMDTGLLVTDLMGFGVNIVTGDYSRGASGFWVEGGKPQYPVEEITIAGNLADIFKGIVAIGNDVEMRGNIRTGSILVEAMTVAGC